MPNAHIDYLNFQANPPTERDLFFIALGICAAEEMVTLAGENLTKITLYVQAISETMRMEVN